jgi:fatty acid elongase 3
MYSDFDWAAAPLSSREVPWVACVAYLVIVFALPYVVPKGGVKGIGLKYILAGHNLLLSVISFVLWAGCLFEMFNRYRREGTTKWMFCEDPAAKARGPLYFWSYMFYLSKYYEMVDTFLAMLKDSPPPHFKLHVYHHALVPAMIWHWMEYCTTLQHPGLLWNAFVHVVMYYYYFCKLVDIPTPWKKNVTRLQIVQFMSSVVLLTFTLNYIWGDLLGSSCAGLTSMWVNLAFNMTFLWQFIQVLLTPPRDKASHAKKA